MEVKCVQCKRVLMTYDIPSPVDTDLCSLVLRCQLCVGKNSARVSVITWQDSKIKMEKERAQTLDLTKVRA